MLPNQSLPEVAPAWRVVTAWADEEREPPERVARTLAGAVAEGHLAATTQVPAAQRQGHARWYAVQAPTARARQALIERVTWASGAQAEPAAVVHAEVSESKKAQLRAVLSGRRESREYPVVYWLQRALKGLDIARPDFLAWLEAAGMPIPAFWREPGDLDVQSDIALGRDRREQLRGFAESNESRSTERQEEWDRWRAAGEAINAGRTRKASGRKLAALVKEKLNLPDSIETIRKRL